VCTRLATFWLGATQVETSSLRQAIHICMSIKRIVITASLDELLRTSSFLHHAQIDRVWWIWQNQDLNTRLTAIGDTITILNQPPSRNGTLDDLIDLGVNGAPITIRSVMSTLGGDLCYTYV
jgi:hypothetical protein